MFSVSSGKSCGYIETTALIAMKVTLKEELKFFEIFPKVLSLLLCHKDNGSIRFVKLAIVLLARLNKHI